MMKEIMTAFNILLVALLLVGCTTPGSSSRPQKDWLFAHIATEAEILNPTTIVMPMTQNIIAFTSGPFLKHADLSGEKFTLLLGDSQSKSFKTGPRNALLSWLDGISRQEVKVVVTGAKISAKGKSITYTTEAMTDMDGIIAVASPHLYLDRYYANRRHYKYELEDPAHSATYQFTERERQFQQRMEQKEFKTPVSRLPRLEVD
jgi:hypothetical protein|tara:strand:- start:748 stop:1359 length:612 start_codon:yes stop_codon:yes gene_type:complete